MRTVLYNAEMLHERGLSWLFLSGVMDGTKENLKWLLLYLLGLYLLPEGNILYTGCRTCGVTWFRNVTMVRMRLRYGYIILSLQSVHMERM